MILECENKPPLSDPSPKRLAVRLKTLRSFGLSSYASLSDGVGGYVQMAGGGGLCLLEWRDAASGRHFRAWHKGRSAAFPDGTLLCCGAGRIAMQADEWFAIDKVIEAFTCFLAGEAWPADIRWRDVGDWLFGMSAPG